MWCIFGQDLNGEQVPLVCGTEEQCNKEAEEKACLIEQERKIKFDRFVLIKK